MINPDGTPLLSKSLSISPSQLFVHDIRTMKSFYHDKAGLDILSSSADSVLLGRNHTGIIELVQRLDLAIAKPSTAGLFHNAIVFDSRGDLSRTVGNIIVTSPRAFTGTGDHLVSEAFYFDDPEGNGVELYFDRPMDTWKYVDGRIVMDALYIDPIEYIRSNASEHSSTDRKLGHVHLRVGDIGVAKSFYVDTLGFTIMADMGSALFVSIAGYHHHIGLNTWNSDGAGARTPSLGLAEVVIKLSSSQDIHDLFDRLVAKKIIVHDEKGRLVTMDPWGNKLVFHS